MNPYTYLVPLVSVLVGLAVTDVAKSLHVLLGARRRVRWDALPLASALLAVLVAYNLWWRLFGAGEAAGHLTLGGFLPLALQLVLLYLVCAAALPDAVPDDGLDLRAFYDANGRTLWTLFALYVAVLVATRLVRLALGDGGPGGWTLAANVASLATFVVLAVVRRRSVHAVALALLLGLAVVDWGDFSLAVS